MSVSNEIVIEIWKKSPDNIIDLKKFVLDFLHDAGKSDLEALESLNNILRNVKKKLKEKIDSAREKGITPNFEFTTFSNDIIIGCSITEKDKNLKQKLLFRDTIYNIVKEMEWELFENLCAYILDLYHFEKVGLGNRTKDGGLDFFGYYIPHQKSDYSGFLAQMNSRIFGQSKHYDIKIGESLVREFHSLYCDFLIGAGRAYDYICSKQAWFLDVKGPIIPFFVSNNEFTGPAIEFAERKGIIIREGVQIVEDILRLSRSELWFSEKDEEICFSEEMFIKFLKEY